MPHLDESTIKSWCIEYIRSNLEISSEEVGPDASFTEMGIDSAASAYFIVELEEWLGTELYPEIVADHPTISDLAHYIVARGAGSSSPPD